MNKHLIILPILLASAISLHVLSFYIEEPDQIVINNPISSASPISSLPSPSESTVSSPVSSSESSSNPEVSPEPNKSVVATSVPSQQKSPSSVTPSVVASGKVSSSTPPIPSKPPTPSQVPVATPTPSVAPIQVVSAYIKPKDTSDIVKEAKMSGGRADPFLSLKPPDITALPSLPPSVQKSISITKINSKSGKSKKINGKDISIYRAPLIPNGESPISANTNKSDSNNNTPTSVEPTQKPEDVIELRVKDRMDKNLLLTGIITGDKKFAIISVKGSNGSESKVVSIGQDVTVILGTTIKLIAISTSANTVTVSSGRNSVILKMKEAN